MKTIYKYELREQSYQTVEIPGGPGAWFLHVGWQPDALYVWAMVDTDKPMQDVRFKILGTGWPIEGDGVEWSFVGTVQTPVGLVWHVFKERAG